MNENGETLIYVAGNPDLYPLEYYDADSQTYQGAIPSFLEQFARERADAWGLGLQIDACDVFPNTVSHRTSNEKIRSVCRELGIPVRDLPSPHRSSEDFGYYTKQIPGAFFEIGSGETCSDLHTVGMDFPDAIIPTAVDLFLGLIGRK